MINRFLNFVLALLVISFSAIVLFAPQARALECPEGFGQVPPLPPYSNQPYCVMKYEARKLENVKWNWISFADAQAKCVNSYDNGDLPTNALWQSMARQAEMIAENWTQGIQGVGRLLPDVKIGNDKFYEMGNGHWEHVQGFQTQPVGPINVADLQSGGPKFSLNDIWGDLKFHFGPTLGYGAYTAASGLGMITRRVTTKIMRGGDDDAGEQGIFAYAGNHNGEAASDVSFRCTCPLAACGH